MLWLGVKLFLYFVDFAKSEYQKRCQCLLSHPLPSRACSPALISEASDNTLSCFPPHQSQILSPFSSSSILTWNLQLKVLWAFLPPPYPQSPPQSWLFQHQAPFYLKRDKRKMTILIRCILFLLRTGAEIILVTQAAFTYWYLTATKVWCTPGVYM